MLDILTSWSIGTVILTAAGYFLTRACQPLLNLEGRYEWVADMVEKALGTVTVSIFLSLPVVAAFGITYGSYRLGATVRAFL